MYISEVIFGFWYVFPQHWRYSLLTVQHFCVGRLRVLSGPVGKLHNTRLRGSAMDASTFGKVMSSEDKYLVTVTLPQSAFEADISQAEDVSPCFIAKRPCGCSLIIHVVSEWESACLGDSDAKLPQWQMHCVRLRRKFQDGLLQFLPQINFPSWQERSFARQLTRLTWWHVHPGCISDIFCHSQTCVVLMCEGSYQGRG